MAGGAVAALIALPYGLALASLMGLPPLLGVFTSILTAPFCALLGSNPVLIGGTSSVTVPFIAEAARDQGVPGAAKLCISAAVLMLVFCVLRLGRSIAKVPHAVLAGFSCGIGAMMIISQLRTMLALPQPQTGWQSTMLLQLVQVIGNIGRAELTATLLACIVIGVASVTDQMLQPDVVLVG